MANLNGFNSNNSANNNSSVNNNGGVINPPANPAVENEASFVWGTDPVTQYIIIETTLSGKSFQMPNVVAGGKGGTLANVWPGKLHWSPSTKQAGALRLFTKLSAMVLQRDSNGTPILDEEGELSWKDGIQVTLCKQGLTKAQLKDIEGLEAMASAKPEMSTAIQGLIDGIKSQSGWVKQKLNSKRFVTGLCDSGDSILPVMMYLNMAFSAKEAQEFVKKVQKLGDQPALLRFYIPMEQLSMPKEAYEPVKVKVGNGVIDLKNPNTGEAIMAPVFSWGNRTQPIAKIELVPGKYIPSSEGMDRVLSVEETGKRVEMMQREWQAKEEASLFLWGECLKAKFSSSGNQWAHKAGALPKRSAGVYADSCTLWEDAKESPAKLEKWSEALRALVNVKPRLNEENQKGTSNKMFSSEACEAIIASATIQNIQPWLDYIQGIGGAVKASVPVTPVVQAPAPVVVTPVEVAPAPVIEPEVQAIEEPSEADIMAAILAAREEQGLDDLEEDEDLMGDFFGGNVID